MLNLLYDERTIIGRLWRYFSVYFVTLPKPTADNLFVLVLAMLVLESADSIRSLYRHFISGFTKKALTTYYRTISSSKADHTPFLGVTASLALGIVPESLRGLPVFLCIDDTLVGKSGTEFECVSKLFDHAAHNGADYLNGHCFVSLMLCVPVWRGRRYVYEGVPLGYRMWRKGEGTKLSLAAGMVRDVMGRLSDVRQVVLLADSWYGKSEVFSLTREFANLDAVCGVRHDTALYDLAPPRTGRRGRPASRGGRLSLYGDFALRPEKRGGYHVGHRRVLTNLLERVPVHAFATSPNASGTGRRLFISTVDPASISMPCAWSDKEPLNRCGSAWMDFIPLFWYGFRWNIEVGYYEHKTFWSLCRYMVRSASGIEMMVNLVCVAYSAMKILPYSDPMFAEHKGESPQEFRFFLSGKVREQVFLRRFVESAEKDEKMNGVVDAVKRWIFTESMAA